MVGTKGRLISVSKRIKNTGILRIADKYTAIIFCAFFIVGLASCIALTLTQGWTLYESMQFLSLPFIVLGVVEIISKGKYLYGLVALAAVAILWFLNTDYAMIAVYLLVCSQGVVNIVELMQRRVFYEVMDIIEHINVKEKKTIKDKLVEFFFNVPDCIDTRDVRIDPVSGRNGFPWKEVVDTMWFFLLFCVLLWINVFTSSHLEQELTGVPMQTFTVMLYLLAIVMPWSIFNTLDARVVTGHHDYRLYKGLLSTVERMVIPALIILVIVLVSVMSEPGELKYVLYSLAMMIIMTVITAFIYYRGKEMVVTKEISEKWNSYHPVSIYSGLDSDGESAGIEIPGTPERNLDECFRLRRNQGRY